jgi:hypothetical protein
MPELIVMDSTGDTRLEFKPVAESVEDEAAVAKSMAVFAEMMGQGYIAAQYTGNGDEKFLTRSFDPTAPKIVMYPQLIGG